MRCVIAQLVHQLSVCPDIVAVASRFVLVQREPHYLQDGRPADWFTQLRELDRQLNAPDLRDLLDCNRASAPPHVSSHSTTPAPEPSKDSAAATKRAADVESAQAAGAADGQAPPGLRTIPRDRRVDGNVDDAGRRTIVLRRKDRPAEKMADPRLAA